MYIFFIYTFVHICLSYIRVSCIRVLCICMRVCVCVFCICVVCKYIPFGSYERSPRYRNKKLKKEKNGEEHKGITTTRDHRMSRKSNRNGNENRMAGRVEIRFRIPVYFRFRVVTYIPSELRVGAILLGFLNLGQSFCNLKVNS
jgi:hypothetical protein